MDLGLAEKVALVAAASEGMGRATATAFAREGCKVAICARTPGHLEAAAEAIRRTTHVEVLAVPADVSRPEGVSSFVEAAMQRFAGVDILVPNAGGPPSSSFEGTTEAQWAEAWNLTFQSTIHLVRACLPSMRTRGGGAIVAILSQSVREPIDHLVLSNSLRLGVVGALKTLMREAAADGIRVNGVAPGWIATDRTIELHRAQADREGRAVEEVQASILEAIPFGRLGSPEEVADTIVFLASERASYLTGVIVPVDGGLFRGLF